MAQVNPRLAAGVGVASVFLLLGGPGVATAIADPGGSHSDRGGSSDRGRGGDNHGSRGHGPRNGHGNGPGGGGSSQILDTSRVGTTGGSNTARSGSDSARSGAIASIEAPQSRVGNNRQDVAGPVSDTPAADPVIATPGIAALPSGSGSDVARTGEFTPPRVTIGNGRLPGTLTVDPKPRWQPQAPWSPPAAEPPPPPPPAPPAPPAPWTFRIPVPSLNGESGLPTPVDWSDPLWGLAGLLLIPAAGAAVGYRQARAAHAAERLGSP